MASGMWTSSTGQALVWCFPKTSWLTSRATQFQASSIYILVGNAAEETIYIDLSQISL